MSTRCLGLREFWEAMAPGVRQNLWGILLFKTIDYVERGMAAN